MSKPKPVSIPMEYATEDEIDAARAYYQDKDIDIAEIDDDAQVSRADDDCRVAAWVWLSADMLQEHLEGKSTNGHTKSES